jgi:ABC-type branched-subunit amino acid transport system ATPase component
VRLLCGIHAPRHGRVRWQDRDIAGQPPHLIVRLGIAQVPEGRQVFPNQSVQTNLRLGIRGGCQPRRSAKPSKEFISNFPASQSVEVNSPAHFPAANNRCWPSAVH